MHSKVFVKTLYHTINGLFVVPAVAIAQRQRTLTIGVKITIRLVSRLTRQVLTKKNIVSI